MEKPYKLAGWLGLAVLLMSLSFLAVFPSTMHRMEEGFVTPIIAFEFVETPDQVRALFLIPGGGVDQTLVDKMNLGNYLDYGYMVLYAAMLGVFAFLKQKRTNSNLYWFPLALAAAALVADALENIQLLQLTSLLPGGAMESSLALLHVFTWLKWGSLAAAFALLAPGFWKDGKASRILAVLCGLCPILAVASYISPGAASEAFALVVGLCFIGTMVYGFVKKEPQSA